MLSSRVWIFCLNVSLSRCLYAQKDGRKNYWFWYIVRSGMRCLPRAKIPQAAGCVLHDWHAETIAMRAFNRFLLEECLLLAQNPGEPESSALIRLRDTLEISETSGFQPFRIREDVKIYMYCSEAPCGDASMELVIQAQEDPTPWPIESLSLESESSQELKGRSHFSVLGIVRRKPCMIVYTLWDYVVPSAAKLSLARPDCPATLSKSCSDKLALKQCTSLLGSLASILISPSNAYIDSLVLPRPAYNKTACDRAFGTSGRLKPLADKIWRGGHRFSPFQVVATQREFCSSRRSLSSPSLKLKASNISAVYTPRLQESLINGVLQGRKQFDPRGGSALCNARLWKLYSEVANEMALPSIQRMLNLKSYQELKLSEQLRSRLEVKEEVRDEALRVWVPNDGDHLDLVLDQ